MTALPNTIALASIADGSLEVAVDHRNNYAAIQTAVNALIAAFSGGTAGQPLSALSSSSVGYSSLAGLISSMGADVNAGDSAHQGFGLFARHADVGARISYAARIDADTVDRWNLDATGKMQWGPGGGTAVDTNFYRVAAGFLQTDGSLQVVTDFKARANAAAQVFAGDIGGGVAGFFLGLAADVNLYRAAAARLKTDHLFDATTLASATKQKAGAPVDGDWAAAPPNGTLIVDSTNNKIWARVGGVWKGVVVA